MSLYGGADTIAPLSSDLKHPSPAPASLPPSTEPLDDISSFGSSSPSLSPSPPASPDGLRQRTGKTHEEENIKKEEEHLKVYGLDRTDFLWTMTEEPHRSRRLAILKAHPEVRSLPSPFPDCC